MPEQLKMKKKKETAIIIVMLTITVILAFVGIMTGSSNMNFAESVKALFGNGTPAQVRIIQNIRIPRVLAAIIAGAGLALSGHVMQTNLNNPMASPSTLGVSNAAVFGANLSIIAFAGGYLSTGHNVRNIDTGVNPFATSLIAFIFSTLSILLILGLCRVRMFRPGVVVLAGIAIGAIWSAGTTLLQFYATDVGLSAAVIWTFGDLGRATYKTDIIMGVTVLCGFMFFSVAGWRLNAMLSGDAVARSMGVNVSRLRFISMLFASVITAVCVSFLGVIGFVGIICPHIIKRVLGQDHSYALPASALCGSMLLLVADTLSRSIGNGAALPVGAITSLFGAPFFLVIIFAGKGESADA